MCGSVCNDAEFFFGKVLHERGANFWKWAVHIHEPNPGQHLGDMQVKLCPEERELFFCCSAGFHGFDDWVVVHPATRLAKLFPQQFNELGWAHCGQIIGGWRFK